MARNLPYSYDVDATFYYAMYPDVASSGDPAARHYHVYGWHEGRNPDSFFDTLGYLATYQDVAAAGIDPLAHFHNFGFREGRTPSPAFDGDAYLAANPDVAAAGIDPLAHYLRFGQYEGRQAIAKPLYDADGSGNVVADHAGAGTGTGVTFSWGGFVSPNLTYSLVGDTSGGGFAVNAATGQVYVADASKIDYASSGPSHSYTVTVTASDLGHTISQTATIAVGHVNAAPVAMSDAVSATEAGGIDNGTPGLDPSFNVLTNDRDPDRGDKLTVQGVTAGSSNAALTMGAGSDIAGTYGTIHINADGSATYVVDNANTTVQGLQSKSAPLTDTFSYTVKDSGGLTSTTQVTVAVHGQDDAPLVGAGHALAYTENQGATAIDPALSVTDVDGNILTGATVQITGNYVNGEDVLGGPNQSSTTDADGYQQLLDYRTSM